MDITQAPHSTEGAADTDQTPAWARIRERLRLRRPHPGRLDSYLPHAYFTDGVNLYRFVGWIDRSVNAMFAELEDCRSLDIVLVSVEDLARSVLRPVSTPVPASL